MWDPRMTPQVERIIGAGAPDVAIEEEAPPSIVINPHSALGKELRRWEQHRGPLTPVGTNPGNPYVYRPYPRMLYKADQAPNGQTTCIMPNPHPWDYSTQDELVRAQLIQEGWNTNHTMKVHTEEQERIAKGQGWAEDPIKALELYEQRQQAVAEAAAQAAFYANRMSEQAKRELKEAGEATHQHVVDVKPRRGRPRKVQAVTGSGVVED